MILVFDWKMVKTSCAPHHSQRRPQQSTSSWLVDDPQTQVLQPLWGGVDESGGERGVVPFDHSVAGYHHAVGGAGVRQLPEMGHHIGHGEGRVRIQRDGRDLELLIAEAGGVERLESRWSREREENGRKEE